MVFCHFWNVKFITEAKDFCVFFDGSYKWWDSLTHETKLDYIKRMNCFNWGDVLCVSGISKF
jgi:hypothetical protein